MVRTERSALMRPRLEEAEVLAIHPLYNRGDPFVTAVMRRAKQFLLPPQTFDRMSLFRRFLHWLAGTQARVLRRFEI